MGWIIVEMGSLMMGGCMSQKKKEPDGSVD
jgi:hypothetical protein